MLKITDQVGIVETAKSDVNTPKEMIGQYTQQLLDLFSKGQSRLSNFENKNSLLLEKPDYMMLKLEFSDVKHGKAESLRNWMVGESCPYKGKFRKMRVEYQNLLSCPFNSQPPAAVAPTVVAQTRKEYVFLKPSRLLFSPANPRTLFAGNS